MAFRESIRTTGLGRFAARVVGTSRSLAVRASGPPFRIDSTDVVGAGRESFHNGGLRILGRQPIEIGSYCAFGREIMLVTENHDTNYLAVQGLVYRRLWSIAHPGVTRTPPSPTRTKGGIVIGSDVWIGDRSIVMSGVTIGHGACVGANSVVTKDVEPYAVVVGAPARPIRRRVDAEVADILLDARWWEWPESKIAAHRELFTTDLNEIGAERVRELLGDASAT